MKVSQFKIAQIIHFIKNQINLNDFYKSLIKIKKIDINGQQKYHFPPST